MKFEENLRWWVDWLGQLTENNKIIIHAFIKRRNLACCSKALNNDIVRVTRKTNSKIR